MSKADEKEETVSVETESQENAVDDQTTEGSDDTKKIVAVKDVKDADPVDSVKSPLGDPEQYMKHPLQNRWALWFFKNERGKRWEENLRLVTKFDTVEDFWALYNHIQLSSKLQTGCDYNLFKDDIQPMWEDDANRKGGKWVLQLSRQQRANELDKIWLETLLCLIGEGFGEDSDYVNGAVVSIRTKGDRAAIWTSDYKNKASIMNIGEIYKKRLYLPKKCTIGFQSHEDTMSKTGSTVKNRFIV